jgi:hypothetical protein
MLRRLRQLSSPDRWLLAQSGLLVLYVRIGLWVLPYNALRSSLLRRPKTSYGQYPSSRIIWAVSAVSRYVPKASCLTRAIAAETLLRINGYPAAVHIGVARSETDAFEAHAWVECQGRIVLGGLGIERFTPLRPSLK